MQIINYYLSLCAYYYYNFPFSFFSSTFFYVDGYSIHINTKYKAETYGYKLMAFMDNMRSGRYNLNYYKLKKYNVTFYKSKIQVYKRVQGTVKIYSGNIFIGITISLFFQFFSSSNVRLVLIETVL